MGLVPTTKDVDQASSGTRRGDVRLRDRSDAENWKPLATDDIPEVRNHDLEAGTLGVEERKDV